MLRVVLYSLERSINQCLGFRIGWITLGPRRELLVRGIELSCMAVWNLTITCVAFILGKRFPLTRFFPFLRICIDVADSSTNTNCLNRSIGIGELNQILLTFA